MSKDISRYNKNNEFDGEFSDSEDDDEIKLDQFKEEIAYRVQEKHENILSRFRKYMDQPTFITAKGDPKTNIVDMQCMVGNAVTARTYNVPDTAISKMFKYMEIIRRRNLKMRIYEKQQEMSGLMIDFDIYQDSAESRLNDGLERSILFATIKLLIKYVNFESKFSLYLAITKKPKIMYNSEKKCYKDGMHILIPGVKLNRESKKFLLSRLVAENFYSDMEFSYPEFNGLTHLDFVDKNSAHVPVYFYGSSSKVGSPPYELSGVYVHEIIPAQMNSGILNKCTEFEPDKDGKYSVNIIHELSLNWAHSSGVIPKQNFRLKEAYIQAASQFRTTATDEEKHDSEEDLLALKTQNPEIQFIIGLLDALAPFRSYEYMDWFKVICALAKAGPSYKPLAKYFSKKAPSKYNEADFEKYWVQAMKSKNNHVTLGSLHYWAKEDNPDRYESLRNESVFSVIFKKIYDRIMEGSLQHYDIAQILYMCLQHKYVYDAAEGGNWYEFVLPGEREDSSVSYKWIRCEDSPGSMRRYISEVLPTMFLKIYDKITSMIQGLTSEKDIAYHNMVKKNFQLAARGLKNGTFKNGVMREAQHTFEKYGFLQKMDTDPLILGVGNGILKLGKECQLVTGYHDYIISEFTTTIYTPFNPHNEKTKKLLIALRNIFPDDEPDTFNFMMHYLASALDAKKKESLLLLLVGNGSNGKSFLIELFRGTVGGNFIIKMPLSFLTSRQKNSETATPALMALMKARMATYSETEQAEILHSAKIKEITGQETLGGRKNFGDFINFKPTCHHLVTSNYDFEVNSTDHGTWRRLKRVSMKIKFCRASDSSYDEKNPYERLIDPSCGASWPDDPEIRSAFLGILVYYYESLQKNYNGLVADVPHPTIEWETEQFHNRQDKINQFINERIVRTDEQYETTLSNIIEQYNRWHDRLYPSDRDYKKSIMLQFENSKLSKYMTRSKSGNFVKGYRVLEQDERPNSNEAFFMCDEVTDKGKKIAMSETAEEFYIRVCREYDEAKRVNDVQIKARADLNAQRQHMLDPEITRPASAPKPKPELITKEFDQAGYEIKNTLSIDPEFKEYLSQVLSDDDEVVIEADSESDCE